MRELEHEQAKKDRGQPYSLAVIAAAETAIRVLDDEEKRFPLLNDPPEPDNAPEPYDDAEDFARHE